MSDEVTQGLRAARERCNDFMAGLGHSPPIAICGLSERFDRSEIRTVARGGALDRSCGGTVKSASVRADEWHLDFDNAFRHQAFDLGAWLCQPFVGTALPLFQTRFVAIGSVSDSMGGDGIQ